MNVATSTSEKTIYIEVQDTRGMVVPQGNGKGFAKLTDEKLAEIAETARSTANALVARLTEFAPLDVADEWFA